MAYGKIKADTLVYDNSGSDTEITISSIGSKASLPASAGTVGASEVVQVDANKDITGFRNITLSGDLTVNGTTTTIDSTTLTVEDKKFELGKVSTPTDTTADGGGITLKGATDKTFNWVDATDSWTSSEHIHLGTNKELKLGTNQDLRLYSDGTHNIFLGSNGADFKFKDSGLTSAVFDTSQGVYLYWNNTLKFQTSDIGITVTGTVTDSKGELRTIPQLSKSSGHTIVAFDAGKHSINSSGGWTIDTSTGFTAGQAITLINNSSGDQTITSTGVTLYNSADGNTPTKLATRGMATVICTATNVYYISGAGLS